VLNIIGEKYISWNVDPSCNRGFHETNFSNPNLIAGAQGLYPSRLRFGGSGADNLVYSFSENSPDCAAIDPTVCLTKPDYTLPGCLNASHWDRVYNLAKESGSDFIFGVSFGLEEACMAPKSYTWNSSNAARLLNYVKANNQSLWGLELGNELNNEGGSPCFLQPQAQAAAVEKLAGLLAGTSTVLIGPDTGYLNPQDWLSAYLPLVGNRLYSVTHHVYSGISPKSFADPNKLDSTLPEIAWYTSLLQRLAPGTEIWAGEDGPIGGGNDGTCGVGSVCGTFACVGWYADDLALRSKHGFKQYNRQDLFGGAYGLLNSPTSKMALGANEPVVIKPDYWTAFLWKRTLGTQVLNATSSDPFLRAYAFTGPPPSPYSPKSCQSSNMQLLLLNLRNETSLQVTLPPAPNHFSAWLVSPQAGNPLGSQALINSVPAPGVIDVSTADPAAFLRGIIWPPISGEVAGGITLPPLTTAFLCYLSLNNN